MVYKWRDKPATVREPRRQQLANEIKRIFEGSDGTYGSPKIWITLVRNGWRVLLRFQLDRWRPSKQTKLTTPPVPATALAGPASRSGRRRR
ncbi:hypothetical protein DKG34_38415 [Streptomyces sp. NWU49]|uniref:IS3 family transposase n=1 Tax=Streptomyces sp. NWU49 TaxID=2201153 RepID=UPI000D67FE83|nr:hypothetical protein DKG34_38415 [Streptomyces sp. NWU49]